MISQSESDGGSRMSGYGVYRADRRFTPTINYQLPSICGVLHANSRFTLTVIQIQVPTEDARLGPV